MAKRSAKSTRGTSNKPAISKAPSGADSQRQPVIDLPGVKHKSQVFDPPGHPWLTHTRSFSTAQPALGAIFQEWLLTNGTGAYAMGSVPGVNTRRYHGLLVASTRPPIGRIVVLHQMLEQVVLMSSPGAGESGAASGEQVLETSSLVFKGGDGQWLYAPAGHGLLRSFQKGLWCRWIYTWGQVRITRELYLHWQDQAATLRYQVDSLDGGPLPGAVKLRLSPMMGLRDFHACERQGQGVAWRSDVRADRVTLRRGELSATITCTSGPQLARWQPTADLYWYNIFYPAEEERGQDCFEDYFVPGSYEITLNPESSAGSPREVMFTVALGDRPADPQGWTIDERKERLEPLAIRLTPVPPEVTPPETEAALRDPMLPRILALAADDFVVGRTHGGQSFTTIMAGYPWFADWGRDTFIALSGLLLSTQRFDEARDCLKLYAGAVKDGLVPNRFDDYDDQAAHYNTVDSSLWFMKSGLDYLQASGDRDSWHEWLAPVCLQIMDAYIRGTHHSIRVGGDGLVTAGNPTTQLTWMDAATGGVVFTPRPGKCVEINALWFHALISLAEMIRHSPEIDGRVADHYLKLADRIKRSFLKVFWDEESGCLRDHVWVDETGKDWPDRTIRPNQILAVSLPTTPLPRTKQLQVLDRVRSNLLTPMGLRTLPQHDAHYHARYSGPQFERDKAYHQGTIWPWLIGPYCEAILRTGDFSSDARRQALRVITPLLDDLLGDGWGQLHEIHEAQTDALGRHRGVGCPAQAWSVGELLRVLQLVQLQ